ncbi:MAG: hypothetical protein WEA34_05060 [Gemmatimonadota bacterium]
MYERNHIPSRRKSWSVMLALVATVASGCDESTVAPPVEEEVVLPGAITVTTVTSGFMKDDGYELMVNGESAGAIGPNDEITVPELDPSTYELALGDVANNCSVEAVSVDVSAEQTAETTLSVVCAPGEGTAYTIQFGRERPNLDDGVVLECPFSICGDNTAWDIYVHNSTQTEPHAVIRQNQTLDLEIAHLPGVTLDALTEEDVAGAVFTTELVADPFDAGRVILIRTDVGGVYALGNPVEDGTAMTLSFDAVLVANPSS